MINKIKIGNVGYAVLSILFTLSTTSIHANYNILPVELQANKQKSMEILKHSLLVNKKNIIKISDEKIIITRVSKISNDNTETDILPTQELQIELSEMKNISGENVDPDLIKSDKIIGLSVRKIKQREPEKTNIIMEQAYDMLNQGFDEMAIYLYKRAIKQDHENKITMLGLAATYQKNMQLTQARIVYNEFLQQYPAYNDALKNYIILIARDNPRTAISTLEKLAEINPEYVPVYTQTGKLYVSQDNKIAAIMPLIKAIKLKPNIPEHRYRLAVTLDKLNPHQRAAKLYKQVLQLHNQGYSIPISTKKIQNRITYIRTYQN